MKNKSYGSKEKRAILQVIDKNPYLTSFQVKMRLRKTLRHLFPRTIRQITVKNLGRLAAVAARKPFLTDQIKLDRVGWTKDQSEEVKEELGPGPFCGRSYVLNQS